MSGTSIDGIDAALVDFSNDQIQLVDFHYQAFSTELRLRIQQISQPGQAVTLEDYGALDAELGAHFGLAALALLEKAKAPAAAIQAIGSHGQTVYHAPNGQYGFSLQIGDPNRIAEITGITTIGDFRRRDIAAGGQGAPLVPAFHQAAFGHANETATVLNIGGIANITILDQQRVLGFDTGPGNTLLDLWSQQQQGKAYDAGGTWAAQGKVNSELLRHLTDDPYFRLAPPKSTGTEYFSPNWLRQKIQPFSALNPADIQATLCQLTADSIAEAILAHAADSKRVLACGGGVHNRTLMTMLKHRLSMPLESTTAFGIAPDHVEAVAFAWLARQTLLGKPGNLCSVTGAQKPVTLGGIYPARN